MISDEIQGGSLLTAQSFLLRQPLIKVNGSPMGVEKVLSCVRDIFVENEKIIRFHLKKISLGIIALKFLGNIRVQHSTTNPKFPLTSPAIIQGMGY